MDSQKPKNLLTKLPAIEDLEIDNENHEDYDVETQPAGLTFKCSKCSMVFDQYIVYKLHLKAAKPLNEIKKCKDCYFTSCTKAGLKAHEKEEEEKQLKELNEVLYEKARVFLATWKNFIV